jgi:hypothetical protein
MDIYTTCFTYPRRSRNSHSPSSSTASAAGVGGPATGSSGDQPYISSNQSQQQFGNNAAEPLPVAADAEAVSKLAMMAMSMHGCHISYTSTDQGRAWNFLISGAYQQVMMARGTILKESPVQVSGRAKCIHTADSRSDEISYSIAPQFVSLVLKSSTLRHPCLL